MATRVVRQRVRNVFGDTFRKNTIHNICADILMCFFEMFRFRMVSRVDENKIENNRNLFDGICTYTRGRDGEQFIHHYQLGQLLVIILTTRTYKRVQLR